MGKEAYQRSEHVRRMTTLETVQFLLEAARRLQPALVVNLVHVNLVHHTRLCRALKAPTLEANP